MYTDEIENDPCLPECLKFYPSKSKHADIWVVETIRQLNPAWWVRLIQGYNQAFNEIGVHRPHQELNARKKMANLWLLDKLKRFG